MARPSGPKTRCGGRWTEARFTSFVKGGLRQLSQRWPPINEARTSALVKRGHYKCNSCKQVVTKTKIVNGKRVNNVFIDHIEPVVPISGEFSWNAIINSMFCEASNLQLLCLDCHTVKCKQEAAKRAEVRNNG